MEAFGSVRLESPIAATSCAVFSSPHSGRRYPRDLILRARLDPLELRRSEDAFVEELFSTAPDHGAPLLHTTIPRAYVDLNRGAEEMDPALVEDVRSTGLNPRLAAGLGVIPRIVAEGKPIYDGKLPHAEARRRLRRHYRPYHVQLERLLQDAKARRGMAILFDCHSMPSDALRSVGRMARPEIILGDRFGASCAPWLTDYCEQAFRDNGFRVARNAPFAGGYITQTYGRPTRDTHAIQIEIDRALYMDESRIRRSARFTEFRDALRPVVAALANAGVSAPGAALAAEYGPSGRFAMDPRGRDAG